MRGNKRVGLVIRHIHVQFCYIVKIATTNWGFFFQLEASSMRAIDFQCNSQFLRSHSSSSHLLGQ